MKPNKPDSFSVKDMQAKGMTLPEYLELHESRVIEEVLDATDDNKSKAAFILGIPRATLIFKMRNAIKLKHRILPARQPRQIQ